MISETSATGKMRGFSPFNYVLRTISTSFDTNSLAGHQNPVLCGPMHCLAWGGAGSLLAICLTMLGKKQPHQSHPWLN
jgi:hypothetical protein